MLAPTEEQVTLALPLLDRPFDRDPAFRHRQRPVFDGVGRQFVQRHCQRQGNLRGEPYMGTGGGEAIGIPVLEREQGSIHDITDRRAFDLILDQQLLRGSPTIATSSRQATTAGGSKTGTEPKTPSPGSPSPAVNPVGQQGPPTDAAASTPDGVRHRPWAPPIDYRDNRRAAERWDQYWAPIGGQFYAPVDT